MNKRLRTPIGMPNHPGLYPVDRSAARWLSIMSVRSRPGWPRLGVSNPWFRCESASMMRTYAAGSTLRNSCWPPPPAPHGHDASLVFPDGPTETGHTMGPLPLRARPEKSDVGITCSPPRALLSVLYGPPTACYAGIAHRECVICSFAVLSLHFPGVQVSIISTLSADFDRQFDYRCHSRRTRDFGVRSHASFSRAIGGLARGKFQDFTLA